jgi:small-conductance mechanosensitive channel
VTETAATADRHPIGLIVDDDLRRNRLTVFFRLLLAIPQLIWLYFFGIVAAFALFFAWIAALIMGRVPSGLHNFLAGYQRLTTHVAAYTLLIANPWPPFGGAFGTYPVDLRVDEAASQSRLTVFFRGLLAIPALVLAYVFRIVNTLIAVLGWFYSLIFGRMHEGMRDLSAWMLQFEMQTYCYLFLLTGRYPSFAGGPKA